MATQTAPTKTGLEKWQDGIDKAIGNPQWDVWDCDILKAVNEFNQHLSGTPGYVPLDWHFIKAMLWVESGAHQPGWHSKPIQIGVSMDPGMDAFLSGNEGGHLILPPAWQGRLTPEMVRTMPTHNIRAGIGYLLMRLAHYEYQVVLDADTKIYEITVKPGDSFEKIAKAQGSRRELMEKLNPQINPLRLRSGQVVKYQKASLQRVITGWRPISGISAKNRYNSGTRDPDYAQKIDYALAAVRKGRATACTQ